MEAMGLKSSRSNDMAAEQVIAEYLDKYFYPTILPRVGCTWRRIHDKKSQMAGVDVQVTLPEGKEVAIDEKAQVDYLQKPK